MREVPRGHDSIDSHVVGRLLFMSPKLMNLGIWIVRRDAPHLPFSALQASEAVTGHRNQSNPQVGTYLKTYTMLDMLERLEEPHLHVQRYREQESPLWLIFKAASSAIQQIEDGSS